MGVGFFFDNVLPWIFMGWYLFCHVGLTFLVPGSKMWWVVVDLYYELRPLIMPLMVTFALVDAAQGDDPFILGLDVLNVGLYWFWTKDDPPDPRDRWGKRKKALKKLVTPAKKLVPVKVGR